MNKNSVLIIGKNKTGKTRKVLFNEVNDKINNNENLFILDERLEYYNNFGKKLKEKGYNVKVVNFKEPGMSNGYNPFEYITYLYNNGKTDKAIEMLKNMGEYIFRTDIGSADPFWTDMANNYFIGLSLILLKIAKENNDSSATKFYSLLQIIDQGEEKYKDTTYLKEYCSELDLNDPICIALNSILKAPSETRGSIMSVFKQKINNYFMRPELVNSFNSNDFSVEELNKPEKTAVFVVGYKPLNNLSNIIIEQAIDYIYSISNKFNIMLDGFDKLANFNDIEEIIDIANHSDINIYLTTTDKNELINKYKNSKLSNIEEYVELNEIYDYEVLEERCELPTLETHELSRFDFKKYVS